MRVMGLGDEFILSREREKKNVKANKRVNFSKICMKDRIILVIENPHSTASPRKLVILE